MTNAEKYKTAEERASAFMSYCDGGVAQGTYKRCLDGRCVVCVLKWLDLDYKEEKTLPCPFCGSMLIPYDLCGFSFSCACGYRTALKDSRDKAIAAHNRVARAVMAAEKKVEK